MNNEKVERIINAQIELFACISVMGTFVLNKSNKEVDD